MALRFRVFGFTVQGLGLEFSGLRFLGWAFEEFDRAIEGLRIRFSPRLSRV